ncbi:hypothetical protein AYI69_g1700 [Smittium culicis]|uniref:Uncharacterized protein n=1 Tax=Smittium culicis TaxID=133412 RepID=A0A1R1YPN8_9FUNG|nr:hypothetical protein AYI69_g1700 [Smittium culicis]
MFFKKTIIALSSVILTALSQGDDLKIDALFPVGVQGGDLLYVKATVPLPDLDEIMKQPGYEPKLYTENNITQVGWTSSFLNNINNTDSSNPGVNCINCDTKNRAVLDVAALNRCGYCSCGWCRYPNTCCYWNICGRYWYNCIPDIFKPTPIPTPTPKPKTTSTTTTTSSSANPPPTPSSSSSSANPPPTPTPSSSSSSANPPPTPTPSSSSSSANPPPTTTSSLSVDCSFSLGELTVAGSYGNRVPNYDVNQVKVIPCTGLNFVISFDVEQTSDVYFAITNKNGSADQAQVIGTIGSGGGTYSLNQSSYTFKGVLMSGSISKITIVSTDSGMTIYKDSTSMVSILSKDFTYASSLSNAAKNIYFAAYFDDTKIANLSVTCLNNGFCETQTSSSTKSSSRALVTLTPV